MPIKLVVPPEVEQEKMCLEAVRARSYGYDWDTKTFSQISTQNQIGTDVEETLTQNQISADIEEKLMSLRLDIERYQTEQRLSSVELERNILEKMKSQEENFKFLLTIHSQENIIESIQTQIESMKKKLEESLDDNVNLRQVIDSQNREIEQLYQSIETNDKRFNEFQKRVEEEMTSKITELQQKMSELLTKKEKGPNFFTNQSSANIYHMFDGTLYNRNSIQQPDSILLSATKGDITNMSMVSPAVSSLPRSAHSRGLHRHVIKEDAIPNLANLMEESENSSHNVTPKNKSEMSISDVESSCQKISPMLHIQEIPKENVDSILFEKPKPVGLQVREPLKEKPVEELKIEKAAAAPFEIFQSIPKSEEFQATQRRLAESPFVKPKKINVESQRKGLGNHQQSETKLGPGFVSPAIPSARVLSANQMSPTEIKPAPQMSLKSNDIPQRVFQSERHVRSSMDYNSQKEEQRIQFENPKIMNENSRDYCTQSMNNLTSSDLNTITGSTLTEDVIKDGKQPVCYIPNTEKKTPKHPSYEDFDPAIDEIEFRPIVSSTQNVGNILKQLALAQKIETIPHQDRIDDDHKSAIIHNRKSLLPRIEPPNLSDISLIVNDMDFKSEEKYPWAVSLLSELWLKVQTLFSQYQNIEALDCNFRGIMKTNCSFKIRGKEYILEKRIGKGAYGSIFLAKSKHTQEEIALKYQNGSQPPLEFFYMMECQRKFENFAAANNGPDMSACVVQGIYFMYHPVSMESIITMPYYSHGTLLDVINRGKLTRQQKEMFSGYVCLELLLLVKQLHQEAFILHADIKPDNIFIRGPLPFINSKEAFHLVNNVGQVICLGDFGQSVYLKFFNENANFRGKAAPSGFQCVEMVTNQPWKYQIDLFNVAAVVHALVYNQYMDINYDHQKECWMPKKTAISPRALKLNFFWETFFSKLVNVKSCSADDYPDLDYLIHQCDKSLCIYDSIWNENAKTINQVLGF